MKKENIEIKESLKQIKGITLVALVITIVILIILSTITINFAFGEDGLIKQAQQAKNLTEQATRNEEEALNTAMSEFANLMEESGATKPEEPSTNTVEEPDPEPETPTVDDAKDSGEKFEDTTEIKDDLENEVTIPGGFHIAEDSGTKVEEGIVIEDDAGNQFVWIPVGEYKVSTTIDSTGKLTNNLSRRTFTSSGATEVSGDEAIDVNYYGEGDSRSVAYNQIGEFKTSATNNGGYYIGRYEQGEGNVCKSGVNPYANITRDQAKSQAEAMYNGNSYITSELISSYAWDTALNFICQTNSTGYVLATTTSNKYGNIATDSKTQTGKYEADKYNNIYDLLGNCIEWSTEHSTSSTGNSVTRGAPYVAAGYVAVRTPSAINSSMEYCSFRVQLYL